MKLIIQGDRIAATATDDYVGPDTSLPEPLDFDVLRLTEYRVVGGKLIIPPPAFVTMRQARLALLGAGLLSQVNELIAAMAGTEGDAARIEWEFAQEVRRDSPLLRSLVGVMNIDSAALDALFVQAAAL